MHKRILVTLQYTENSMRFFLYDFEGNPKGEFRYRQEAKYKLPLAFLNAGKKPSLVKEKFTYSGLTGIYPYKGDFLVFLGQTENVRFTDDDKTFKIHCLVFSHTGKFKKRMECCDNVEIRSVTPDGYVLGVLKGDEDVNVTIFKMEI
ncbi:MAG: hypothetical protein GY765_19045 [bacterium]|nr:hypothetical protein [bacterium]